MAVRPDYPYRWYLRRVLPERHGQRCRIVAWGGEAVTTSSGTRDWSISAAAKRVLIEFWDGTRVVAARAAIKTARGYARARSPADWRKR